MGNARYRRLGREGMGGIYCRHLGVGWLRPAINSHQLQILLALSVPSSFQHFPNYLSQLYRSLTPNASCIGFIGLDGNLPSFRRICRGWWWQHGQPWGLNRKYSVTLATILPRIMLGTYTSFRLSLMSNCCRDGAALDLQFRAKILSGCSLTL